MHKWNGYYKKAKTPLKSGWTEDMYREHAFELYNIAEGKPFKLAHCVDTLFQLLNFMPVLGDNGWSDEIAEEDFIQSASLTGDGDGDEDISNKKPAAKVNNIGSAMGNSMNRPMGAKKAKAIQEKEHRNSKASKHSDSMIASAQILADQAGRLAAAMEKKQQVDFLWNLMDFYLMVNRTDDAYNISKKFEAIELRNFPAEATPHALGEASPASATMPTMLPNPGFPGHYSQHEFPLMIFPLQISQFQPVLPLWPPPLLQLQLRQQNRKLVRIMTVILVMLLAGLDMDAARMKSLRMLLKFKCFIHIYKLYFRFFHLVLNH
jgi:hypothetical protein